MTQVVLDGRLLGERGQVRQAFAEAGLLPDWCGAGLDALFDALTACPQPVHIRLLHPAALEQRLGGWGRALCRMLRDACAENPQLTLEELDAD